MKQFNYKKILLWGSVVFFIIVILLLGWREYAISQLPFDDLRIPPLGIEEKLEIPPRPGIQGIIIRGPEIHSLVFEIDLSKPGVRFLDWNALTQIDPNTDVKVSCRVNVRGRLVFSQADILMEGHTEAGLMIQRALRTWIYRPYKSGIIRFWFNLPSKGRKLIIDITGLRRRGDIPAYVPVYNGKLYSIDGIPVSEVQVGKYF